MGQLTTLLSQLTGLLTPSASLIISAALPLALTLTAEYYLAEWLRPGWFRISYLTDLLASSGSTAIQASVTLLWFAAASQLLSMLQPLMFETLEGKHTGPLRALLTSSEAARAKGLNQELQEIINQRIALESDAVMPEIAFPGSNWVGVSDNPQRIPSEMRDFLKARKAEVELKINTTMPFLFARDEREAYSVTQLAPTRLGNIGRTIRVYGLTRYGIDVDVFWTRLQRTILAKSTTFADSLKTSKSYVDFAVSMVFLTTGLWFAWTLWLVTMSAPFEQIVLLAVGGPLVTYGFYLLACQNYLVFTDQMRTAIDLYRQDLLEDYRLARPANSDEEQLVWERLGDHVSTGVKVYMTYTRRG